jgi:hypothetical protein
MGEIPGDILMVVVQNLAPDVLKTMICTGLGEDAPLRLRR